ncbi:uncharacterized protein LOC135476369 [Liolophura sinensis]|uniref:uncharacterized protein LOC135476369 n=1 Tax=Liolophura sinensis TaxID=3198878 RepID=UPI003158CBE2
MAAPMSVRATAALRWYLLSSQRDFISNRVTGTTRCLPRLYFNICNRCLSSKIDDKQNSPHSTTEDGEANVNNNDVNEREADDFFGILENLRTPDPVFSGDTETHESLVTESEHLNQERVLDVHFGFIRRDADNPALPRDNRGRIKLRKSSSGVRQNTHESADYFSRLLGHEQESDSGSNQSDVGLKSKSTSSQHNDSAIDNSRPILQKQGHINLVQSDEPVLTHVDVDMTEPNFIDKQYFDSKYLGDTGDVRTKSLNSVKVSEGTSSLRQEHTVNRVKDDACISGGKDTVSFIDEQYFVKSDDQSKNDISLHLNDVSQNDFKSFPKNICEKHENAESDLHFVDDQYFSTIKITKNNSEGTSSVDNKKSDNVKTMPGFEKFSPEYKHSDENSESTLKYQIMKKMSQDSVRHRTQSSEYDSNVGESETSNEDIIISKITRQSERLSKKVKPNLEEPQTAYDMAMKIRLENAGRVTSVQVKNEKGVPTTRSGKKLDSKGFRILKDQVPDWTYTPKEVLAKVLKDSIIYDNNDIVVIDKPYGLPSHGKMFRLLVKLGASVAELVSALVQRGPGVASSVGQMTPLLAQLLDRTGKLEDLHLIHRLDKETTGVMILARTPQMASQLRELFRKRKVIKKYWLITKGIPNPAEGIIDIPIGESTSQKFYKMCLRPEHKEETKLVTRKSSLIGHDAVTQYRVLDSHHQCALVECQPFTGVKHQLRVHMAHALNTPILGDHKYSHFNKLAPQKLYPEILQRLGIRQSKVRYLAMHLHAKLIVLPEFLDGRNLVLSAYLPRHFVANMKKLKLNQPSK